MPIQIQPLFDGQCVKRSIRFNHDHIKPDHPTAGLPWRIIDRDTGEQTFAASITCSGTFQTEMEEVNGACGPELKGNIVVIGHFSIEPVSKAVYISKYLPCQENVATQIAG